MSESTHALRPVALVAGAALLGCPFVATAADDNDSGPYVGAAYGEFDTSIEDIEGLEEAIDDFDADDSAWKAFFGWRFNPYLALEVDYVDLGNPRGNFDATGSSGDYELELSGFAGYVIGALPLGIFELSAKVGYYFHDLEIQVDLDNIGPGDGDVFDSDDSGEAFVYGVGAGVTFIEHINVKLEYELMDIDNLDDPYTIWLTGAWRF
jgi:opacity protein-like surface antigen